MTASIGEMRTALAAVLAVIQGLHTYATWPKQVTPPAVLVRPESGDYLFTLGQDDGKWKFICHVVVSIAGGLDVAQAQLDPMLSIDGDSSIRQTLRADPTLGDVVDDLIVEGFDTYTSVTINGVEYLGAIVHVEVWT